MLTSLSLLHYALYKPKNYLHEPYVERYSKEATDKILVVIAVVILIIEICLIYFAIKIALTCSGKDPKDKAIHMLAAIFLTVPYLLLALIFGMCKK